VRVIWSPQALRQIDHVASYLAEFNPRAAAEFTVRLIEASDSLVHFCHRGRPVAGTTMRELVAIHPYVIRYRIVRDEVRILRVRHGAQRPMKP
jgi:addiction module RelE/StbE family toxin